MKNKIAILIMLAAMMTACGTFKKAATTPDTTTTTTTTPTVNTDPVDDVIASLGQWRTMQTGSHCYVTPIKDATGTVTTNAFN